MDLFIKRSQYTTKSANGKRQVHSGVPSRSKGHFKETDFYENVSLQNVQMMMQLEQSLIEELSTVNGAKEAKKRRIQELEDDIRKDENKEELLRKKINELRMNRLMAQNRVDRLNKFL